MSNVELLNKAIPGNLKQKLDAQNQLSDMNELLLEQMQLLASIDTDEVTPEQLTKATQRSAALASLADKVISSERLLFDQKKEFSIVSTQKLIG